ncbi:MAG: hypothetical protein AB1830_04700 [Pseudomonadota bacterium]
MADAPFWKFRRMQPGEMNIDPIESEFFSTEALGSLADALVREAIQNSLDARSPGEPVRVRIAFSPPGAWLQGERADRYFVGLWRHLAADRSGLARLPSPEEPVGFLVVEDYGTRGLQGDPRQSEDEEIGPGGARNDFYYFWRNVGRSRKQWSELGRWGLGKTVFPAASRINSFFALTVRRDDGRRLLMGQSVLRIHKLDGARYYPYGYFGRFQDDFALPVEEAGVLGAFCHDFAIKRGDEPGLSVVIPYPDPDLKPEAILPSVVRHYFLPILAGDLVVEVAHDRRTEVLDARSVLRLAESTGWAEGPRLQSFIELARWGLDLPEARYVRLPEPPPEAAPRWAGDASVDAALAPLRAAFNNGRRVAVRVPVWVKPADGEGALASFEVFLERDDALSGAEEHFVRDGITVAGVRSGLQGGVRAIVCVRDRRLSALLGDSENPAHTEWQERSPRFKERYRHGPFTLRYVKSAPREIVRSLTRPAQGRDFHLLRHLFSLEVPTEETVATKDKRKEERIGVDGTAEAGQVETVAKDRFFQLQKLRGGFRLTGAPGAEAVPRFVEVVAAYEVRRGNPFSLYEPFDFEMDRPPIDVQTRGAQAVRRERNRVVVRIDDPGFQVTMKGFDPRRDVRVKVLRLEEAP